MFRAAGLTLGLLACSATAAADQYWVAYEGNDFPESEGWTRVHHGSPAQRWIEDGKLFIDSREPAGIYDYYVMVFSGNLNPDPGETFVIRWRLKVDLVSNFADPVIGVTSDDLRGAGFEFGEDRVWTAYGPAIWRYFEPRVFHDYEFRSTDMQSYRFYIDGQLAIEEAFYDASEPARVGWGDGMSNRSLAEWDYVRFGVVPERPSALLFLWAGAVVGGQWRRLARAGVAAPAREARRPVCRGVP